MKHPGLFCLLLLLFTNGMAQVPLSAVIDSAAEADRKWRRIQLQVSNGQNKEYTNQQIYQKVAEQDNKNATVIRWVISTYGFPDFDKVSKETSHNFWYIVQHQDQNRGLQDTVLGLMGPAMEAGKAHGMDYAYLLDRVLLGKGQKQLYGTQMRINADGTSYEPMPVQTPDSLNIWRKAVGLPDIKSYIRMMNEKNPGKLKK